MEISQGTWIALSIGGGIAALIAALIAVARRRRRASLDEWECFALERGLVFHRPAKISGEARIEGRVGDRAFEMFEFTISSGSGSDSGTRVVTRMALVPRGMPDGLAAQERATGGIAKAVERMAFELAERLGGPIPDEVVTGDPAIDEEWVVRGFDADEVREWMASATRREALFELSSDRNIDVVDDAIRWQGSTPNKRDEIEYRPPNPSSIRLRVASSGGPALGVVGPFLVFLLDRRRIPPSVSGLTCGGVMSEESGLSTTGDVHAADATKARFRAAWQGAPDGPALSRM